MGTTRQPILCADTYRQAEAVTQQIEIRRRREDMAAQGMSAEAIEQVFEQM